LLHLPTSDHPQQSQLRKTRRRDSHLLKARLCATCGLPTYYPQNVLRQLLIPRTRSALLRRDVVSCASAARSRSAASNSFTALVARLLPSSSTHGEWAVVPRAVARALRTFGLSKNFGFKSRTTLSIDDQGNGHVRNYEIYREKQKQLPVAGKEQHVDP
jgi:hypothetical protein